MIKENFNLGVENLAEKKEKAKKDLQALGLKTVPENIELVLEEGKTPQFPLGAVEIVQNIDNPEALQAVMEKSGIKKITHVEGPTAWDHTKKAIEIAESMDLSAEEKTDLKLIMFFHDLGKTEAWNTAENIESTRKKVSKGDFYNSMIGHAGNKMDKIEKGLEANGVAPEKIVIMKKVIADHMKTSLLEQDPKKTFQNFKAYGETEEEIMDVVKLLTKALEIDALATESIELVDGALKFSKNEKKLALNFESVWKKYKEGEKITKQEEEKAAKKKEQDALEKDVFGMKLSDYLAKKRGVKPGPKIGETISMVRDLMEKNQKLTPEEIKKIIDGTEF